MRFEIVKSRAKKLYTPGATNYQLQWHARVMGDNNEVIWTTETYKKRAAAMDAINALADYFGQGYFYGYVKTVDLTRDPKPKKKGKR